MPDRLEWSTAESTGVSVAFAGDEFAGYDEPVTEPFALVIGSQVIEGGKNELRELLYRAQTKLDAAEPPEPPEPEDPLAGLREACGYDPEGDGSVDDLIGYKDALEDLAYGLHGDLAKLIEAAGEAVEKDNAYWERVATGQDTEQAEASGHLTGQLSGLQAAKALLAGDRAKAEGALDLYDREADESATPLTKED